MRIEIACEKGQAKFHSDLEVNNFPFHFVFADRNSNNIIDVCLDLDSLAVLYDSMKDYLDMKMLTEQFNKIKREDEKKST